MFHKQINKQRMEFDGNQAYQYVLFQQSLGPRIPGTEGHAQLIKWIEEKLIEWDWKVEIQDTKIQGRTVTNLIASREIGSNYILIGAHYDTRRYADQDPDPALRKSPVPGANDGASGVAVLMELARILPQDLAIPVRLVFFDAEDNGGIGDWDWIMGSRAFVQRLEDPPQAVVVVDMVGDSELTLYREQTSNTEILDQIWEQADELGYEGFFLQETRYAILDDHTPFLEVGIPAVNIIDFDYPYWHTTGDTIDKVSPDSLRIVGHTLYSWLLTVN
jgi:Zn-dependent M28 family amino/carboxypeptidase